MIKHLLLALCILCTAEIVHAQNEQNDRQDFPKFVTLSQSVPLTDKNQVLDQYLLIKQNDELRSVSITQDDLGFTHDKMQQYFEGIKVEGAIYTIHAKNGNITHMTGEFYDIQNLNTTAALSERYAFGMALAHVNADQYMWEEGAPLDEQADHMNHDSEHATEAPVGELVIYNDGLSKSSVSRLAYKFDIYAAEPLSRAYLYIDAQTGQVLGENQRIHHADGPATGTSLYNGTVSFTADNYSGGNYQLRQSTDGGGIETYDLNNGTNYNNASDITSSSSSFTNNATGVQAHYGAEQTYQYFSLDHSRNSYNGSGGVLRSYISYSSNYVNAFWDGSRMTYGDGDGVNYGPLVSLDITGHEIAHGVTEFSANLAYQRESGALNESFSDIFGEMVEYHALGSNNWQMGTDIGIGGSGALRSMDNPNAFNDPDTYGGSFWTTPNCGTPTQSNDYCGVHSNSGVQNKWFYILSIGESGTNDLGNAYTVTGLGRTKAAAIAYRNLTQYLGVNSTFADARSGAIQAAVDLYGAGSAEEIATTNAWYAVGVGQEYGNNSVSYCSSNGNNVNDEYIQRVQLNTIDNTSGSGGGYTDHTSISTDLAKSSSFTITITPLWTGTIYSEGYSVWIDYNQDGDFGDAGEQVTTVSNTTATPVSGTFTVPASATDGPTRMRVSMKYNGVPTSCESFTYGEVEDYTVNIGTSGGGDTEAPSTPTSLSASGTTETSTDLSWNASTDNVAVTAYSVFLNGSSIGTVTGTSANITGLTASTTYSFYVTAEDAAGNVSGASNTISVTTDAPAGDTQAPTAATLVAGVTTTTTADLSWSGATDNVGVTGYTVYVNGSSVGSTTSTSYTVSGLTASTGYTAYVTAQDAAGNSSANSNTASFTTQSAGGGPTEIFGSFFESGLDGWSDGGSDCYRYSGSNAYEGSYSMRLRDNSNSSVMTSTGFDATGFNSIDVEFFFRMVSMENGEDFWLQINTGSGYQTAAAWARGSGGVNNNTFYTSTVTLTDADWNFSSNTRLRFRNDASGNSDWTYIDAITVTGSTATVAGPGFAGGVITTPVSSESVVNSLTGGMGNFEEELLIYPNPVNGMMTVETHDETVSMSIYTIEGKLVRHMESSSNSNTVDVADLASGLYIIQVRTSEEILRSKFRKE